MMHLERRKLSRILRNSLLYITIIIVLVTFLVPPIWVALTSIRSGSEINTVPPVWIPKNLTAVNYVNAIWGYSGQSGKVPLARYVLNSAVASLTSTVMALIVGALAGYSFSRFKFRRRDTLYFSILLARAIPGIALSLPLLILFARVGLHDTLQGLIVAYSALNIPFVTWMMEGFFREIPIELDEAAYVDGCSRFGTFLRIAIPLAKPGLAASAIFSFLLSWNEFPIAFILTYSLASRTAPVGLFDFLQEFFIDWSGLCAAATVLLIPTLIFTFAIRKQIVRGITFGAVKG